MILCFPIDLCAIIRVIINPFLARLHAKENRKRKAEETLGKLIFLAMNGLVVSTDEITLSRRKNLSRSCISLVDLTSFRIGKKWRIKNVKHRLIDRIISEENARFDCVQRICYLVRCIYVSLSFSHFYAFDERNWYVIRTESKVNDGVKFHRMKA